MKKDYWGWVPTVSGALSFSTFGDVSHKPRAVCANRADRTTRYLLVFRGKDCSDILLPFRSIVAPWFLNLQGKLWFVCVARSESIPQAGQDSIGGMVYIFHDRESWRRDVEPILRSAQERLIRYRFGVDGLLVDYFAEYYESLLSKLQPLSAFNAEFSIQRSGITRISLSDPMIVHASAPTLPSVEPNRAHMQHVLAAQLFFFLRDIGHRHQHHDPATDTIVDLHEDNPADPMEWRLRTLYSLYRKVIAYKRIKNRAAFASSLGVAAYANSFRQIIEQDIDEDTRRRMPNFFFSNVIQSIHSVGEEVGRREQERLRSDDVTRQIALGFIGIILAIVAVYQITGKNLSVEPSPIIRMLAELLITSPLLTLTAVILIICMFHGSILRWITDNIGKKVLRLIQPFKLWVAASICIVVGSALLILIYWIVWRQ